MPPTRASGSRSRAYAAPLGPAHPGRTGGAAARRRGGTAGRGRGALVAHRARRGPEPLVPALPEERFEQSLDLEWPIEGLEPLSFVLGRLIEPLSAHLERRDRGVAVLHVRLHLVNKTMHEQSLQLPTPMRDAEGAAHARVAGAGVEPSGRGHRSRDGDRRSHAGPRLQHSLLTRPVPMPEQSPR